MWEGGTGSWRVDRGRSGGSIRSGGGGGGMSVVDHMW